MKGFIINFCLAVFSMLIPSFASAQTSVQTEEFRVSLIDNQGKSIEIAHLLKDATNYAIVWHDEKLDDYFLSMRPFKCLKGPKKLWCRVPYPYEIKRSLVDGDLTDLEYDLLFVWKNINDYGIDMWHGVYYKMAAIDAGFEGTLYEMDLGILAVPPDAGNLRPIGEFDLEEGDPESHWLPKLSITRK